MKTERYSYKGKTCTRFIEEPYSSWVVSVDLGKRIDYTAVSVFEHTREPIDEWVADEVKCTTRQKVLERYTVRGLQRLPLGVDYPVQADHIAGLLSRPPLHGYADMVIDEASVGTAVADDFEARWAVKPVRVTVHGTAAEVIRHGPRKFTVPKLQIVSHLDAKLNNGELVFAEGLSDSEALRDEMTNFQQTVTATNQFSFEARSGKHDDLVISLGMGLWWCVEKRKRNRFHVGPVLGMY